MNIFFLHHDPVIAAHNLNYPRLQQKMILEGTQLVTSTLNLHGFTTKYKTTHAKHPSRLWLENSLFNITWLVEHTRALLAIYGKPHKCEPVLNECCDLIPKLLLHIPDNGLTLPYLAMGAVPEIREQHSTLIKHGEQDVWLADSWDNAVTAYRSYMQTKDYWKPEYSFKD